MEFDPSRRLFLRRAGLASVAPIVAPVLPIEKVVKYFFAPNGGWNSGDLPIEMVRKYAPPKSIVGMRLDSLFGISFSWESYERLVNMESSGD